MAATGIKAGSVGAANGRRGLLSSLWGNKLLYMMLIPGILMVIAFRYIPMYGVIMAFEKFRLAKGVFGSQWIWFENFAQFFRDPSSFSVIRNTFV